MTCPNLYINPTVWPSDPHPAEYWNGAIDLHGSSNFTQGASRPITVTVRNHGTQTSPLSLMELFWSDPSTGFVAMNSRKIPSDQNGIILGSDGIDDGVLPFDYNWTPDLSIVFPNGGHVCLLARVSNIGAPALPCMMQTYDAASPATDWRSAIHNVQVIAPPPPPPPPGGGGGGGGGRGCLPLNFAFAATNTLRGLEDTKLEVRALDPVKDRDRLLSIANNKVVHQALCCGQRKFRQPDAVLVAEGRERVILPPRVLAGQFEHPQCIPRIGRLGPLSVKRIDRLVMPGTRLMEHKGPIDLKLHTGEMRQTLVQLRHTCQDERAAFAVDVNHKGADGQVIGGLVLVFVPPVDPV